MGLYILFSNYFLGDFSLTCSFNIHKNTFFATLNICDAIFFSCNRYQLHVISTHLFKMRFHYQQTRQKIDIFYVILSIYIEEFRARCRKSNYSFNVHALLFAQCRKIFILIEGGKFCLILYSTKMGYFYAHLLGLEF